MISKVLSAVATLLALPLAHGTAGAAQPIPDPALERPYVSPQRLVEIEEGRRLNLVCSGSGSPTVILDAGFGDDSLTWRRLQPILAQHTTVCSYDRAGERFSDSGPLPRDVAAMTSDLHRLVEAAAIAKPFVLVGHSMGGMNALLYADRYEPDLAGLVLLDPGVMDTKAQFVKVLHNAEAVRSFWKHLAVCEAAASIQDRAQVRECAKRSALIGPSFTNELNTTNLQIASKSTHWSTLLSEDQSLESTGGQTPDDDELREAQRSLGDLPMVVTMRTDPLDPTLPSDIDRQLWSIVRQADEKLSKLSSQGKLVIVSNTSHWVHLDQPQKTAQLILAIVDGARASLIAKQP